MALVLIAEDERAIRDLLAVVLKGAGHEVLTAANGIEAVALYRSYYDQIDLVITDINMPEMDGCEAVARIRETCADVKIICMSGHAGREIPQDVVFLAKPFRPDEVRRAVSHILDAR